MLLEEDILMVNSDDEVDLVEVLGNKTAAQGGEYDAYDPYFADSDGNNSWHSEEMKTPPNSEDEDTTDDSDDVFPQFNEGARFGECNLQVGMKFNTKQDFIEAVREFTIQEGRQIKWRRNESYRARAICK
ncbi:uncharacterized protein LOC110270863 [Arachis ipaensis]|uniref:uncharacterized protein LOC110270863 n=1 Tax=Arachis ipaensis TaxID=130454 RepID=UPI000A2B2D53|nr:uncharacterized protein LOC110270863 [Arachis ipaensis]XP_025645810.1 uncharacterized protein LOC112741163 [Arachis hypogaea]